MSSLPLAILLLLGSAVVIYLSCEWFVNGVEWVGRKLAVGQQATGTILAAFAFYVRAEIAEEAGDEEGETEPLKLQPGRAEPSTAMALIQTSLALVVIFFASREFVGQLGVIGPALGLPPQLVALLLSPIATELPETMNAIIWVRQGKHRLALANISGAMMIQATIPTALGLFFTPWLLGRPLLIGAAATAAAIVTMFLAFRSGRISRRLLAAMALFYAGFVAALLA